METTIRKVLDFITFETPLKQADIVTQFDTTLLTIPDEQYTPSTSIIKQKLVASYWLNYVTTHYCILFVFSFLLTIFFTGGVVYPIDYMSVLVVGIICFTTLVLFLYIPSFCFSYLPSLQIIKERYDQTHLGNVEKCRRQQLSNFALCLVFYVFDKVCSMNKLQPNDQYAGILLKLYGVDQGSLKKHLELIFLNSTKRRFLTDRKKTEIRNRFSEAYSFFEEINFPDAVSILRQLESKLI